MTQQTDISADVEALLKAVANAGDMTDKIPVAAQLRAAREAARREEERLVDELLAGGGNPLAWIGKRIRNEGIFMGRYEPKDRDRNGIGKVFNVFAAPQDLPTLLTYGNAVQHIAKLQNWCGHDGASYGSYQTFLEALKTGRYNGGWIIPPSTLTVGVNLYGFVEMEMERGNFVDLKDKGDFRDSFKTQAAKKKRRKKQKGLVPQQETPDWYWTLKAYKNDRMPYRARLTDRYGESSFGNTYLCSTRPVRLIEIPR